MSVSIVVPCYNVAPYVEDMSYTATAPKLRKKKA